MGSRSALETAEECLCRISESLKMPGSPTFSAEADEVEKLVAWRDVRENNHVAELAARNPARESVSRPLEIVLSRGDRSLIEDLNATALRIEARLPRIAGGIAE